MKRPCRRAPANAPVPMKPKPPLWDLEMAVFLGRLSHEFRTRTLLDNVEPLEPLPPRFSWTLLLHALIGAWCALCAWDGLH